VEVTPEEQRGVIRHLDANGRELGAFLPRSEVSAQAMLMSGYLVAARDRVGWYSAPLVGSGPQMFAEIFNTGAVVKFAPPRLGTHERVSGLGVLDNGASYITTEESKAWKIYQANRSTLEFTEQVPPDQLTGTRAAIYGSDGSSLVFKAGSRYTLELYRGGE
jgi:hypothetical protein